MLWLGVKHGHSPHVVGWEWPMVMLLKFLHVDLRQQGIKTYKASMRKPITEAQMQRNLDAFRAELDEWEL